jgi:hypothetical protein|tara:strand:- start:259 stop:450 length:192 start_codon:yes stop_codon:yes gene_type:complete
MTKAQENKRLRLIRRISKKLKKESVTMNDIADCVLGYTEKDVNEEMEHLTQYKADNYINSDEG